MPPRSFYSNSKYCVAFLLGNAGAFCAALTCAYGYKPADMDITSSNMLLPYGFAIAIAAPTVLVFRWLNRKLSLAANDTDVTVAALCGATFFDAVAIRWLPALYSHTGPSLTGCATTILIGASGVLAADALI